MTLEIRGQFRYGCIHLEVTDHILSQRMNEITKGIEAQSSVILIIKCFLQQNIICVFLYNLKKLAMHWKNICKNLYNCL